jgi:hypothetical protein
MNQDAFRRFDARSCDRVKHGAFPCVFARRASHPFARPGEALRVMEEPPWPATSPQLRLASRLASRVARKMLLFDFCNRPSTRAPVGRPTPELRGVTARAEQRRLWNHSSRPPAAPGPSCDGPAPGDRALDGALPTSIGPTIARAGRCPMARVRQPSKRCHPTAAFSTACRAGGGSLTPLSRLRSPRA